MATRLFSSSLWFLLFSHVVLCCTSDLFSCEEAEPSCNQSQPKPLGSNWIKCVNFTLQFQFNGQGPWYSAEYNQYPNKTIIVHVPWSAMQLQSESCDFLYIFNPPIRNFSIHDIASPSIFFDCKADSYKFSRDYFYEHYRRSHCTDYDLYYSNEQDKIPTLADPNCTSMGSPVAEWQLQMVKSDDHSEEFSLISLGFSHHCKPVNKSFDCLMRSGECNHVGAESSTCFCHLTCPEKSHKLSVGRKVAIGLGGMTFGLLLAALGFFLYRRHKKKTERLSSLTALFRNASSDPSALSNDPESLSGSYYKTPIFSYEELQEATGNFDEANELGDGGFGVVFKGKLKDGRIIAAKRLYERNYRRIKQFQNEVEILNYLRHRNLVTLYGCTSSRKSQDLILVYEYISNGTVADHLHGPRASEHALTWCIRMNIAIETADALSYLHLHQPQIIHRDVKTSNILLDDSYTVKVADFGLSRLFPLDVTHISTAPQGTPGYVDPEYHQTYQLTDKSDVYSFGVVLVELISSMPAVDITRHRSEINLSNMAVDKIPRGLVDELVDPTIGFHEDPAVRRMVEQVAEVAFRCLQKERDMRPSMDEVRDTLRDIAGVDCADLKGESVVSERLMRDDSCLLKSTYPPCSPNSVADKWIISRSTTPHTSS